MSATKKKKSSEVWRAMLYGREVLSKGLIKRVGPGNSINIWEDNWIQGITSMKPRVGLPVVNVRTIDELFVPGTRIWNEQLVRQSFVPFDADEILKIRPENRLTEDVMAWVHERHGVYSVRSAYRALKAEQIQREREADAGQGSSETQCWWTSLWKLNVPPKVHIFWWRVGLIMGHEDPEGFAGLQTRGSILSNTFCAPPKKGRIESGYVWHLRILDTA